MEKFFQNISKNDRPENKPTLYFARAYGFLPETQPESKISFKKIMKDDNNIKIYSVTIIIVTNDLVHLILIIKMTY